MLSRDRLKELRELAGKATPGPLNFITGKTLVHIETDEGNPLGQGVPLFSVPKRLEPLADLIVETVNQLPAILEEIERLDRCLDQAIKLGGFRISDGNATCGYIGTEGAIRTTRDCPDLATEL